MKKFRFNLQKLLEYRRTLEEKLQAELAGMRAQHDRECQKLARLQDVRDMFRIEMKQKLSKGNPDEIRNAFHYLNELSDRVLAQQKHICSLVAEIDKKTEEVLAASKDRKALERLQEHKKIEYKLETLRQEQKFLDDIASIRHNRAGASADCATGV